MKAKLKCEQTFQNYPNSEKMATMSWSKIVPFSISQIVKYLPKLSKILPFPILQIVKYMPADEMFEIENRKYTFGDIWTKVVKLWIACNPPSLQVQSCSAATKLDQEKTKTICFWILSSCLKSSEILNHARQAQINSSI